MPIKFDPRYSINSAIAKDLMRIEAAKQRVELLPNINPRVLASLRESGKVYTTHYSTQIEGNQLSPEEIKKTLTLKVHFPGRERDELEIKGYYTALAKIEQYVSQEQFITEKMIQTLHALVTSDGGSSVTPMPYRDGQINDSVTRSIAYLPPEAIDVPELMENLVEWIKNNDLPCPIVAAISHYQFATIHPYCNGNGRTARLLTTLILHLGGYDLKGLYSLEDYYAKDLEAYYQAINVGPFRNYYFGRIESDITAWIEYFISGMVISVEKVVGQLMISHNKEDQNHNALIRTLDLRQRKALDLFQRFDVITSSQLKELFGFQSRTNSAICKKWAEEGFLEIVDFSNKARKYKLSQSYKSLIQ